jgi:site-specific recombinase XerD
LPPIPAQCRDRTLPGAPTSDRCLLDAEDDRSALLAFLDRYRNNPNTFSSYTKEIDRFYRWCLVERARPISAVTHADFEEYRDFLSNPWPRERWVSEGRFSRTSERWRPFSGGLSPASIRQSLVILDTAFSWLVESRYLEANPISLVSRRSRSTASRPLERFLPSDVISEIHAWLNSREIASSGAGDLENVRRSRWVFSLLFLTGIRISELASARMQDFRRESRGPDEQERWWLTVTGKGGKTRNVPVDKVLLQELVKYRRDRGMRPVPGLGSSNGEGAEEPAVFSVHGKRSVEDFRTLSRSTVHRIVKEVSEGAADWIQEKATRIRMSGESGQRTSAEGVLENGDRVALEADLLEHQAETVRRMSAHWLRHSYGTALLDSGADVRTAKENLGHASLNTTSVYVHAEDRRRHEESQGLGRLLSPTAPRTPKKD